MNPETQLGLIISLITSHLSILLDPKFGNASFNWSDRPLFINDFISTRDINPLIVKCSLLSINSYAF